MVTNVWYTVRGVPPPPKPKLQIIHREHTISTSNVWNHDSPIFSLSRFFSDVAIYGISRRRAWLSYSLWNMHAIQPYALWTPWLILLLTACHAKGIWPRHMDNESCCGAFLTSIAVQKSWCKDRLLTRLCQSLTDFGGLFRRYIWKYLPNVISLHPWK